MRKIVILLTLILMLSGCSNTNKIDESLSQVEHLSSSCTIEKTSCNNEKTSIEQQYKSILAKYSYGNYISKGKKYESHFDNFVLDLVSNGEYAQAKVFISAAISSGDGHYSIISLEQSLGKLLDNNKYDVYIDFVSTLEKNCSSQGDVYNSLRKSLGANASTEDIFSLMKDKKYSDSLNWAIESSLTEEMINKFLDEDATQVIINTNNQSGYYAGEKNVILDSSDKDELMYYRDSTIYLGDIKWTRKQTRWFNADWNDVMGPYYEDVSTFYYKDKMFYTPYNDVVLGSNAYYYTNNKKGDLVLNDYWINDLEAYYKDDCIFIMNSESDRINVFGVNHKLLGESKLYVTRKK